MILMVSAICYNFPNKIWPLILILLLLSLIWLFFFFFLWLAHSLPKCLTELGWEYIEIHPEPLWSQRLKNSLQRESVWGVNFQWNSSQQEPFQVTTNERHCMFVFLNLVDNPERSDKNSQLVNLYRIQIF